MMTPSKAALAQPSAPKKASLEQRLAAVEAELARFVATYERIAPPPCPVDDKQKEVLAILARAALAGATAVPRDWIALLMGSRSLSGIHNNAFAALAKMGYVYFPARGFVALKFDLPRPWEAEQMPLTLEDILLVIDRVFAKNEAEMLRRLALHGYKWAAREDLASKTEQSVNSSSFAARIAMLRKMNLIEVGGNNKVRLALGWFWNAKKAEVA